MKKILTVALLLLAAVANSASAQSLTQFKQTLAQPVRIDSLTVQTAVVMAREEPSAAAALQRVAQIARTSFPGYRVVIYFNNGNGAREAAVAARDEVEAAMPDVKSYMTYENPNFRVALGNCTSVDEALMLQNRVKDYFPKAFISRENIKNTELLPRKTE